VEESPDRFAPLIEAARALGLRIGWLDLQNGQEPPTVPGDLETAASQGVLRAVAVGGGRTVAVKPLRGAPVLNDLLREHFQGCALVLIRGEVDAPSLRPSESGEHDWEVKTGDRSRSYTSAALAETLRKPHPWE
jgi:hypothetical protein